MHKTKAASNRGGIAPASRNVQTEVVWERHGEGWGMGVEGGNQSKACSLKRWVHFRWAVVLSCFYTSLFKTICYICDFSFSISVFFLLCIGIGIFVLKIITLN